MLLGVALETVAGWLMDVQFELRGQRFVWDGDKATSNQAKHAVTFQDAAEVFLDPGLVVIEDPAHSLPSEPRYPGIGFTFELRLLRVTFREPAPRLTRIISARDASTAERRLHVRENR
jgi:uncharacterized protein